MTPEPPTPRGGPLLPRAISFLAPAALVLLPALALALAGGEKNEAYEWLQHRVAAAEFAAAFAALLWWGAWRPGWLAAAAAGLALGSLVVVVPRGLPGMHGLLFAAASLVALGHRYALRRAPPPWLQTVALGLGSFLGFWAVSRLFWHRPFAEIFAAWPSQVLFLTVTVLLVGLLVRLEAEENNDRRGRGDHLIDALVLLALAAAVLRTNVLPGDANFPHHWGVYVVPAELVRQGHALLGEVPSQYGFLSTLVLAVLPTDDRFSAVYWAHCVLGWVTGAIIYFALRTWLARWWWRLGAGLITLSCVAFLCGDTRDLTGSLIYPSIGGLRFIWLFALLGLLLWHHRAAADTGPAGRRLLWLGSSLWLLGVLWSVESAAYVTAVWFPAASLLAMPALTAAAGRTERLRALATGIGRTLGRAGLLLALALLVIAGCYHFLLGRAPAWGAYGEYAAAFSNGFGVLPLEPQGAVWTLVLLHTALLAAVVSLDLHRQRTALALGWAAWGALWAVSTYFISRSHTNNLINLSAVLLLVIGLLVPALRAAGPRSLARPWLWLTVPPFLGAMLLLVLTNPAALRRAWAGYAVEPSVARLLPAAPPALTALLGEIQQTQAGPFAIIDQASYHLEKNGAQPDQPAWLPLGSVPLYIPLPLERRHFYLDAYARERISGWLLFPVETDDAEHAWIFEYVKTHYAIQRTLERENWRAWYLQPHAVSSPPGSGPVRPPAPYSGIAPRLTTWLDHNHPAYWTAAGLATLLFAGWVLAALRANQSAPAAPATGTGWWRAALVLLVLLAAWRWPLWFSPTNFNPDESQLVAGALTLLRDPVFWRSVDGSTAGPLNFYALLAAKLVGAPVNFITARLTGLLLVWGALVFAYGTLRLFAARAPARLALVPVALFFAIVTQDDFVHYSTEHLPLFLFASSTFLLVRRHVTGAGGRWAWWLGGLGLGLLPWAKLQSIPLGAAVVGWLGFALWGNVTLPAAEKRRRGRDLVLAGLAPSVVFLALIAAAGVWPVFVQGYILQNFNYVATDNTVAYLWATTTRSLNLTWHFQACMLGPLLVALAGSLARGERPPALRALGRLGLMVFLAALAAVLIPRRPFAHYLLFLILPLLYWSAAAIGTWWEQPAGRRWRVALCLGLGGVLPLAVRFSQPAPDMLDRLVASRAQPHTAAGNILLAYAQPGDRLGTWGWMCDLHVETRLPQATRQGNSFLCLEESPQLGYYRRLYLADLQRNRPALFVDAVGPTADFFEDRNNKAHEVFPELAAYIRAHYTELIDLEYARLYVRNDRFDAVPLDAAHLRALAATGRRVRGRYAPEPVLVAQPHLPQNVIGGRVVSMMLPRAEISWVLRGTEREFYFEAGYDPRAYLEGDGNGTLFTAELATPSGAVFPIYSRLLDPVHRPADRGLVGDHFPLPPVPAGSRLILRTSPGPEENSVWDWAYLAGAAFDHSPRYTSAQFPGFNRVPDAVTADVTYFETEAGRSVLALHAPASLVFRLNRGERSVMFDFGFREGAWHNGGNTDGATYRVMLRGAGQPDTVVFERALRPVSQPADQGSQHAEFSLPENLAAGAELVLTIDPAGNPAWDWTWLANLQIK